MPTSDPQQTTAVAPYIYRARNGLLILFALLGMSFSTWLARFPTVRELLGLTTAQLGFVLLAGAFGSLIFVTIAGALVERFGGRRILTVSAFGISLAFFLEGLGPAIGSVQVLAVGVFFQGVFVALTNVPQNVETAAVERRMGKAILSHFHAAYSIGAVIGSLIGAACAALNVPLLLQMSAMAGITLAVRLMLIPRVVLDTELSAQTRFDRAQVARRRRVERAEIKAGVVESPDPQGIVGVFRNRKASLGSALGAWREPRTLLIGLVIFAAALSEGSANNWLSIAVVDGFGQKEQIGALALGLFLAAMTIIRIAGPQLLGRFGRVAILRASAIASVVGLLCFGFGPHFGFALVGIVLWGMGAALAVPIVISGASDDPIRAAARVSVVSAFASTASLAAPPILGLVADSIGARLAITTIAIFMLVSLAVSRNVAPLRPDQMTGAVLQDARRDETFH
ncbi:MFS transporter [Populibacterium corticicola]|uniref:MFS transporter n=1 Tax=Populibacterium corticicola TaxID=1812826 RepID=A0ABW5XH86_9MICO